MSHAINSLYRTGTDAAKYKAWARLLGDTLVSEGWVRTGDTGAVDWASVATMPGASGYRDWEVLRMADVNQATNPIFLKLEYQNLAMKASIGQGTNGSGTLSNPTTPTVIVPVVADEVNPHEVIISACPSGFAALYWPEHGSGWLVWVERSRNGEAFDNRSCMIAQLSGAAGVGQLMSVVRGLAVKPTDYGAVAWPIVLPKTSSLYNGNIAISPVHVWAGEYASPPRLALFGYKSEITDHEVINVPFSGSAREYKAIACSSTQISNVFTTAGIQPLLDWEV